MATLEQFLKKYILYGSKPEMSQCDQVGKTAWKVQYDFYVHHLWFHRIFNFNVKYKKWNS